MEWLRSSSYIEIAAWAHVYHNHTTTLVNLRERFSIGIYQIYQAIKWGGDADHVAIDPMNLSALESLAASAIHFLAVARTLQPTFPPESDIIFWPETEFNPAKVLFYITKAQQQIWYHCCKGMTRAARYDENEFLAAVDLAVHELVGSIPVDKRVASFERASEVMTGRL